MLPNEKRTNTKNCTNCQKAYETPIGLVCSADTQFADRSIFACYKPTAKINYIKHPCKTTCSNHKPVQFTDVTLQQCAFCTHRVPQENNGTLLFLRLFLINTYCMNANKKCTEFKLNPYFKGFIDQKQR